MDRPDYLSHEKTYQELKAKGFQGWGGEKLEERMQGWNKTAEALKNSPDFPKPGSKILELGCGAGDSLIPFSKDYTVTGIDISPTAVEWAKKKVPHAAFLAQSVTDLSNFQDQSFDAVLDSACLHCIIGEDRKMVLREVHRTLKTGGFFLVSHMVNDPRELPENTVFALQTRTQIRGKIPYRAMPTDQELVQDLTSHGFRLIKMETRRNPWWDHFEAWCVKPKK